MTGISTPPQRHENKLAFARRSSHVRKTGKTVWKFSNGQMPPLGDLNSCVEIGGTIEG